MYLHRQGKQERENSVYFISVAYFNIVLNCRKILAQFSRKKEKNCLQILLKYFCHIYIDQSYFLWLAHQKLENKMYVYICLINVNESKILMLFFVDLWLSCKTFWSTQYKFLKLENSKCLLNWNTQSSYEFLSKYVH